jgi:hypothetical protein
MQICTDDPIASVPSLASWVPKGLVRVPYVGLDTCALDHSFLVVHQYSYIVARETSNPRVTARSTHLYIAPRKVWIWRRRSATKGLWRTRKCWKEQSQFAGTVSVVLRKVNKEAKLKDDIVHTNRF